ncbi:predicted protein [Chaetoceros tenuissimus]|uniref:C2 domain-containing protein n=1 Tax=Chaetoceros tenuissimus TaxID=426638 RepID=A0AAD3H6N2_9STRA|nr:predicted protein [Chaetoceros tenuissimus]
MSHNESDTKKKLERQVQQLQSAIKELQSNGDTISRPKRDRNRIHVKEESDFIVELKRKNELLVQESKRLKNKLKSAAMTVWKLRNEIQSMKGRKTRLKLNEKGACSVGVGRGSVDFDEEKDIQHYHRTIRDLTNKIQQLSMENKRLLSGDDEQAIGADNIVFAQKNRIQRMEIEYATLEETSRIQLQVHQEVRAKLQECNNHIQDLKNEITRLKADSTLSLQYKEESKQYKLDMEELIEENNRLETKLANIIELPFFDTPAKVEQPSFQEQLDREELEGLKADIEFYKEKLRESTQENKSLESNLFTSQQENRLMSVVIDDLYEQLDRVEEELTNLQTASVTKIPSCSTCTQTEQNAVSESAEEHSKMRNFVHDIIRNFIGDAKEQQKLSFCESKEQNYSDDDSNIDKSDSQSIIVDAATRNDNASNKVFILTLKVINASIVGGNSCSRFILVLHIMNLEPLISIIEKGTKQPCILHTRNVMKEKWFTTKFEKSATICFEVFEVFNGTFTKIGNASVPLTEIDYVKYGMKTIRLDLLDRKGDQQGNITLEICREEFI